MLGGQAAWVTSSLACFKSLIFWGTCHRIVTRLFSELQSDLF